MRALFPLDGSETTYQALDRGLGLLKGLPGLEVTLLNVRQEGFEAANDPQYIEETYEADEDDEVFPSKASSERCLSEGLAIAERHGLKAETRSVEGKFRDVIVEMAGGFDVLVMHGLGKSNLKDTLKGSSTEKLARSAPCSVLLVRTDDG